MRPGIKTTKSAARIRPVSRCANCPRQRESTFGTMTRLPRQVRPVDSDSHPNSNLPESRLLDASRQLRAEFPKGILTSPANDKSGSFFPSRPTVGARLVAFGVPAIEPGDPPADRWRPTADTNFGTGASPAIRSSHKVGEFPGIRPGCLEPLAALPDSHSIRLGSQAIRRRGTQ